MEAPVIVIDNGTGYLKTGLSTSTKPDFTIPTLVGRPMLRYAQLIEDIELQPIMIGDEILPVRSMLDLTHPMKEGIIQNEDDLVLLWDYVFQKKLRIPVEDMKNRRVLLTEAPLNPNQNKIKMAQILFEKIGVGMMNIEPQAKLTLFCEGLDTGMVLDSGDGVTHCIPITDFTILHHNILRLNIAGRHITNYLTKLLQLKGYAFNSTADFETIRDLKEKYCFVSCDIKGDRKLDQETTFYNSFSKLPDGRTIRISNEKFEATEILFNPYLSQVESPGVHEMVFNSIMASPMDCRKKLYNSIILSGANTMFCGFASRFESEIKKIYKETALKLSDNKEIKINIKIIDSPRRKYSVFIGGTIISKVFNNNSSESLAYWISKAEYDEIGTNVILQKCQNRLD